MDINHIRFKPLKSMIKFNFDPYYMRSKFQNFRQKLHWCDAGENPPQVNVEIRKPLPRDIVAERMRLTHIRLSLFIVC